MTRSPTNLDSRLDGIACNRRWWHGRLAHAPVLRARSTGGAPVPRKSHGFTLIEVLAAIALIVIALPVIMRGISMSAHAASVSKQRTQAAALAELKLNELVGTGNWQYGNLTGDFADEWPGYRWSAELADWTDSSVQQLDVHVQWKGPRGDEKVTLSTLVYSNAPIPINGTANPNGSSNSGASNAGVNTSNGSSGGVK